MTEDEQVKPVLWPGLWLKDEKFWRDVASRTVSGLLILVIGYLYAVVSGYVARPKVWPILIPLLPFTYYYVAILVGAWRTVRKRGWRFLGPHAYWVYALLTGIEVALVWSLF